MYGHFKGEPLRYILGHQRRSLQKDHYKVENRGRDTLCWVWQLGKGRSGYGSIRRNGSASTPAHRWYYEQHYGPIPSGYVAHHLCEVKACVNPEHIQLIAWGPHTSLHVRADRAKLNAEKAQEIRRLHATTEVTKRALARQFGVSHGLIRAILRGDIWKN